MKSDIENFLRELCVGSDSLKKSGPPVEFRIDKVLDSFRLLIAGWNNIDRFHPADTFGDNIDKLSREKKGKITPYHNIYIPKHVAGEKNDHTLHQEVPVAHGDTEMLLEDRHRNIRPSSGCPCLENNPHSHTEQEGPRYGRYKYTIGQGPVIHGFEGSIGKDVVFVKHVPQDPPTVEITWRRQVRGDGTAKKPHKGPHSKLPSHKNH